MIVKTMVFDLCNRKYKNLSELAQAMGISVSQVYRVQEGKRSINQKFIVGAVKAFPEYRWDDLFYFAPELPDGNMANTTVTDNYRHQGSATHSTDEPAAKEKQRMESTEQALEKLSQLQGSMTNTS